MKNAQQNSPVSLLRNEDRRLRILKETILLVILIAFCASPSLAAPKSESDRGERFRHLQSKLSQQPELPVIINFKTSQDLESLSKDKKQKAIKSKQDDIVGKIKKGKVKKIKKFKHLPFMGLMVDQESLDELQNNPDVESIEEDKPLPLHLVDSTPLIGAAGLWESNFSGNGQAVAILDTGIQSSHPFLTDRVIAEACFSTTNPYSSSVCPNGFDEQTGTGAGVNCNTGITADCGHGTHVAGITAGKSSSSFQGVAWGAHLISIQVFSRFDDSSICGTTNTPCVLSYTSDQINALEHVYNLRSQYSIASVNMSLGGGRYSSQATCDAENLAIKAAIDLLRNVNIATVISSGNAGYTNSLGAPGCVSSAISVGATDKEDQISWYSNSASFLDLLAPGTSIQSSIPVSGYAYFSGTSMAAPHVAGAWALMKSIRPDLTVSQIERLLKNTGTTLTDTRNNLTQPRIQLDAAMSALSHKPHIQTINYTPTASGQ